MLRSLYKIGIVEKAPIAFIALELFLYIYIYYYAIILNICRLFGNFIKSVDLLPCGRFIFQA